ncbi:MAG: dipeptidyl carboxypeptidase II, partial [Pseudomonadota bacterium]
MTQKIKSARALPSLLIAASALALTTGCSTMNYQDSSVASAPTPEPVAIPQGTGYFAQDSDLPFLAPDFTKISEDDYIPSFEKGMAIQQAEIQAITENSDAPSFDNTIVAYEKSGRMLGRVSRVFFALTGANTTDGLDAINREISPKLSQHGSSIILNPDLFARVKAVYDQRDTLGLDQESAKLLETTYEDMVIAGASLTEAERERVKAINTELSTLTTEFSQMVREAGNAQPLIVDSAEELAGLSQGAIDAAAAKATELG